MVVYIKQQLNRYDNMWIQLGSIEYCFVIIAGMKVWSGYYYKTNN